MFFLDGAAVTSASDLTTASKCEFAFLRAIDAKLDRVDVVDEAPDAMLARTARLGDLHEETVYERYRSEFATVVGIERADPREPGAIEAAAAETTAAFLGGADLVYQAAFFDGSFLGYADFIVRMADGSYEVQDTKLARSAKVTALLQLAAYAEQLVKIGVRPAPTVRLILGDGSESVHLLRDILPVYRSRRARLDRIVAERLADTEAVRWGDGRYTVCGHCATCQLEIEAHRDLLLVAGLRLTQRDRLIAAGITTIDQLAKTRPGTVVEGMPESTLSALQSQAGLQIQAGDGPPPVDFHTPSVIAHLPAPDPGDVFFDFEGDPLYTEGVASQWGLDYLFGLVENDGTFRTWWAHDFREERDALADFLEYLAVRRAQHPGMHVYHYASYERTHLLSLAARHGVGEDFVDDLMRDSVLVDLYATVRKTMRVGSPSYSIKKLEPLYMTGEHRQGVATAVESIDEYVRYRDAAATGDVEGAARILQSIADYNEEDCVSTLKLRDWLLERAASFGVLPGTAVTPSDRNEEEPSPLRDELLAMAGELLDPDRSDDQRAWGLAAAAIDYHRREAKSFWWDHYARLIEPVEEWADARGVFVVESAELVRDWYQDPGQRVDRRQLRLQGQWAPGSSVRTGGPAKPFAVYEYPGPFEIKNSDPGARPSHGVEIVELYDDGSMLVQELVVKGFEPWAELPVALTPAAPPPGASQVPAIAEWGQALLDAAPGWPKNAVADLIRRTPPRTRSGSLTAALSVDETVPAVIDSLLDLDDSYLAVQGPPGTGKTYLAAHVITALVREHRWKVGVVAQSHAVIENLLDKIVDAGLEVGLVGKNLQSPHEVRFTEIDKDGQLAFLADRIETGCVVGGTAWDFSNPKRFDRCQLDLLVVDEAGQFSLAPTIAASVAARNLLLLGDPQQLPQVSQGTHPEPIDTAALAWVSDGHDVLPAELGYFLAESRRMDAAVTEPVSELSYDGRLHSHPSTRGRHLESVPPGLQVVPVDHAGNSTSSPEEAARVLEIVRASIGTVWTDPTCGRHETPLEAGDIIVVTPYNAQVALLRETLDAEGFDGVRVGTVDKFQGQEAVVSIVSLAASSPAEVPRGLGFLIMKNRLNVAISRAQWASYLVYSPELTEYLPVTPDGVAELSTFLRLVSR